MRISPISVFKTANFNSINCTKPKNLKSPSFGMTGVTENPLPEGEAMESCVAFQEPRKINLMDASAKEIESILGSKDVPDELKTEALLAIDRDKDTPLHLAQTLVQTKALLKGAPNNATRVKMLLAKNRWGTLAIHMKGEKDARYHILQTVLDLTTKAKDVSRDDAIALLEAHSNYAQHPIYGMQDLKEPFNKARKLHKLPQIKNQSEPLTLPKKNPPKAG